MTAEISQEACKSIEEIQSMDFPRVNELISFTDRYIDW